MEITILGTSSMVPTKERNVSAIFLKFKTEGILFDCGEGTQRQMNITGIKRTAVTKILISHWHGDHVSGIIGLLQTMGNNENPPTVHIYGPIETKKRMGHMMNTCIFDQRIKVEVHELDPKDIEVFQETEEYKIECGYLDHSIPTIGFSFTEKERLNIKKEYLEKHNIPDGPHCKKLKLGKDAKYKDKLIPSKDATYKVFRKKISYIPDTLICDNAVALAKDSDLLICESTFASTHTDKSHQYKHMTAKEAALLANKADAKKLVLTHFSQRYKTTEEIEQDARDYFDKVICAEDFMKFKV